MNIRVDLNTPIYDGREVVFRSPVDCSQVTGLILYYPGTDENTSSTEFAFADAHGNNVGDIDHLFAENAVVKVILDLETNMAFVQNADTNAYLEGKFKDTIDKLCPSFAESGSVVACEPVEGYPLEVAWETKNLLDPVRLLQTCEGNGTTLDGDVFTTTFKSGGIHVNYCNRVYFPKGEYTFTFIPLTDGASVAFFVYAKSNGESIVSNKWLDASNTSYTFTADEDFRPCLAGTLGNLGTYSYKLQLEKGTTATTYEPYAETATITHCGKNLFGGDVMADAMVGFGATKNEADGTVSFKCNDLSNSSGWLFDKFKENTRYTAIFYGNSTDVNGCANIRIRYTDNSNDVAYFDENGYCRIVTNPNKQVSALAFIMWTSGAAQTTLYYDKCGIFEGGVSLEDFEAYMGETFAPGEPITALPGVNTVYADAGLVTVTGKADPVAIINKLINAIISLGGNV